jgi:3-oxo-5-alpha-steroid 4-dehydrogenase 1
MEFLITPSSYDTALLIAGIYLGLVIIGGFFVKAPYGRFASENFGFSLSPRMGWFLMELPATLSFLFFYFQGEHKFEAVPLFFLAIWLIHYGNRGFIFPLLMRVAKGQKGSFSISIVAAGWFVTAFHGYLNAVFISHLSEHLNNDWFSDPRFIIGMAIYAFGYLMNLHSDHIIRTLRTKAEVESGEKVYRIPQGGLFKYVTCPSYFTELISFLGFAIATWSLGALFVLGISAANLIPRAFQTHQWYKEKFPEYPKDRKVLIPGLI